MLRLAAAVVAVFCAGQAGAKASKGNCAEKPLTLKATQTATLVNEWQPGEDDEKGEYLDSGALYFKTTLKKYSAYTVWITGGNVADIDLDVDIYWPEYDKDKYDKDKNEGKVPSVSFDVEELPGGQTKVAYLYADDWDEDDPSSGLFLVSLTSDSIGKSTTLGFSAGIRSFTVTGTEESPRSITFEDDKWKSYSGKVIDGSYCFRASLKAGRKYRVRTSGGATKYTYSTTKEKNVYPLLLDVDDGSGDDDDDGDEASEIAQDPAYASDTNNAAYYVFPSVSGKYTFTVTGEEDVDGNGTAQSFKFLYTAVPMRAVASHPFIPLFADNGYETTFVPGRLVNNTTYYDAIVDDHLCRVYLTKGERWVFETSGATQDQTMYLYDTKGTVIATNESLDGDSYDTRIVYTAASTGIYYVGVCDPYLEPTDKATGGAITLSARKTDDLAAPDAWDSADDTILGGSLLAPLPMSTAVWPAEIKGTDVNGDSVTGVLVIPKVYDVIATNAAAAEAYGAVHGPHLLGANDFADCFAIPCRKGLTYRLRTWFADDGQALENLSLTASVYYYASGSRKSMATTGTITPVLADNNEEDDLTFTATANGMHYVRISVAEGEGLDFPAFWVGATVESSTTSEKKFVETSDTGSIYTNTYTVTEYTGLGCLKVESDGGVGTWAIGSETAAYPAGATLALVTRLPTVTFLAETGYKKPAAKQVSVPVSSDGAPTATVTGRYNDSYDSQYVITTTKTSGGKTTTVKTTTHAVGDGDAYGAFPITPAATAASLGRTLWSSDPVDMFKFTASSTAYYDFAVASSSSNLTLVVSNATAKTQVVGTAMADGTGSELIRVKIPAGETYVLVGHGAGTDKDAAYTLTYAKHSPGIARFTDAKGVLKSSYSFKETSEYATLYATRSASEGDVRMRYSTEAVTAQPGDRYCGVSTGEVFWAAGDKSVKTIKIRLLPDEISKWSSSNLKFKVKLTPLDSDELEDGEYTGFANSASVATVTITETGTKKPGTVQIVSYGEGDAETAVSNVKKPVATGIAGETLVLNVERTGGSDGKVSVKIKTSPLTTDTAKSGVDYASKSATLTWADGEDGVKTWAIDLKKASGYTASKKFTLALAAVATGTTPTLPAKTATVTVKNALADQTAAAFVKSVGASGLSAATSGTWYKDYDGVLRSAAAGSMTFTVTGPGFFMAKPSLKLPADGAAAKYVCQFDKESAIDLTADGFSGVVAKAFGSGSHTVKFTVSGVSGGAYGAFEPLDDGAPYLWTQFSKVAAHTPMNKAAVAADGVSAFAWTMPDSLAATTGLYCRVRFGTSSKSLASVAGYDAARAFTVPFSGVLSAGKTYYWAIDYAYTDAASPDETALAALNWASGPVWSFTTVKDGAPTTSVAASATDAAGVKVASRIAAGEAVQLVQGVKPRITLTGTGSANSWRLLGGTLPKGLSVNASTGALSGVPTAPGEYRALLQALVKTAKKSGGKTTYTYTYGESVPVDFEVLSAGTSVGSFRAAVVEQNGDFAANNARRLGTVSATVTSAGKISATATIGGVAYKFSGTGYDSVASRDDSLPGATRTNTVKLTSTTLLNGKTKKYGYMTLNVGDGPLTNAIALAQAAGTVELEMAVCNPKLTAVVKENVAYKGTLYRSNGATEIGAAAAAEFAGYYTVALAPEEVEPSDGVPAGNGYLLATVAANGSVKITGVLADGTSYSCSSFGQTVGGTAASPRDCSFAIPVFAGSSTTYSLGGVLELAYPDPDDEDGTPAAVSAAKLTWARSAAAAASRDGKGFGISTAPTGGWYDKVVNLQKHYLGRKLSVETVDSGDDLPDELLASGYRFTAQSTPRDLDVRFSVNTLATDSRKLAKDPTLALYDFAEGVTSASVNPWAVTIKFTRATGVLTGTLSAWKWYYPTVGGVTYEYPTKQTEIKNLAHKGVFLFTRDGSADSPLADDTQAAGFFLMPVTKNWKASLPFNIVAEDTGETYDTED